MWTESFPAAPPSFLTRPSVYPSSGVLRLTEHPPFSPSYKADCRIPFSACVLVAPNVQGHSRAQFSSAPSNHPSKPCANGPTLESFPEALVEPIAPPTPSLSFYHSSCPWASIVSLPAFLLPKAACTSCKDIFRLSACAWPLPAVSL